MTKIAAVGVPLAAPAAIGAIVTATNGLWGNHAGGR